MGPVVRGKLRGAGRAESALFVRCECLCRCGFAKRYCAACPLTLGGGVADDDQRCELAVGGCVGRALYGFGPSLICIKLAPVARPYGGPGCRFRTDLRDRFCLVVF